MKRTADTLVLGAGIAGTAVAWALARRGVDVAVLERADRACAEASAQNAGMIRRLDAGAASRALSCASHALLTALPLDDWNGVSPFRATGGVVALADATAEPDATELTAAAADLRARGVAVEDWTGDELRTRVPAFAASAVERGWFVPDDGVCDAATLGAGFERGARRRGARFAFDTTVERLVVERGRVTGVVSNRGSWSARHVVLASAAWTDQLIGPLGLPRAPTLTPLARHVFVTAPHAAAGPDTPWCWVEDVGVYARPHDGAFLVSPCDEFTVPRPARDATRRSIGTPTDGSEAATRAKLAATFPALADTAFVDGWTGLRTYPPDRAPRVARDPDVDGLVWATGLGGGGLTNACAVGARVTELIVGARSARTGETANG